jgi:hypothetical protein
MHASVLHFCVHMICCALRQEHWSIGWWTQCVILVLTVCASACCTAAGEEREAGG